MMTDEQLAAHIAAIAKDFTGQCPDFINAIGAVYFGRLYGYRVLRVCISSNAYTKHQRFLGLDFKEVMPEETNLSRRSVGYDIAKKLNKYWEIIRGQFSIDPKDKARFEMK